MSSARYTIAAYGESSVLTDPIELTPEQVTGVITAFDAINAQSTDSYEPEVWLWAGAVPKAMEDAGERRPENPRHFSFRRWEHDADGGSSMWQYNTDEHGVETREFCWKSDMASKPKGLA